ncbi:MAG: Phosphoribosylformylglycinamidine synthase subunit PurL [Myxococcota bacterium]|nr:Phosphoribosylformylglycinamidine synthase subunit PurL [Myxococcota bacterium]
MSVRNEPAITPELVKEHGLTPDEYQRVLAILGRTPTYTELGVFSVMWSEHCSYKSSRAFLGRFPTRGPRVLQGPGENAGVVDIGHGWALAFKMESHNHPSYIEPYQGAATGVGGIMRDVFTMGARPIANLNLLRFGRPEHPKTPYLLDRVVAGIAGYGNCMGVPTVGGELFFDGSYDSNCLVNAMTVGLLRADRIFRGNASGPGNAVLYVGSKTGRDGIHGATMASEAFGEGSEEKRPTVQVGDPFTEKLLLEACLELMEKDIIIGIQDMGAAGLTSSSCEMAGRAGTGVELNLERVPMRETGMTPYELMLSESQERMLMVVKQGGEEEARAVFQKWDLDAEVVGRVTSDGMLRARWHGEVVAEIPAREISDQAPEYERPRSRPRYLDETAKLDESSIPVPSDLNATLVRLLGSPNLCSRRWVWRQYDHQVMVGTVEGPGGGAAVVRLPQTGTGVALTAGCNSRYVFLDPRLGGCIAVAECARNISCTGATPIALTDCLNFGSPENPEVLWTFVEAIEGVSEASEKLDIPVVSGNVSFYNETSGSAVFPTPAIGMVGVMEDVTRAIGIGFSQAGMRVALIGQFRPQAGGSEYLAAIHGKTAGTPPALDLAAEARVQSLVRKLAGDGLLKAAQDVSDGGVAVALAEMCLRPGQPMGVTVRLPGPAASRPDVLLFGETQSSILIAFAPEMEAAVRAAASSADVLFVPLGMTGGAKLVIEGLIDAPLDHLRDAHENGLKKVLEHSRAGAA